VIKFGLEILLKDYRAFKSFMESFTNKNRKMIKLTENEKEEFVMKKLQSWREKENQISLPLINEKSSDDDMMSSIHSDFGHEDNYLNFKYYI